MSSQTFWTILKTEHRKFPFRLVISKNGEAVLDLYVQDKWPGSGKNIFCIRAVGREGLGGTEIEIERVPVLRCSAFGKRLTVILDRAIQKRCSFLFLVRGYKNREGEYEQIFWQTQQGLAQRKTKYKLSYYKSQEMTLFIDTGERYAWNFSGANVVREKLPIGDYALKDRFGLLAVVERKTFSNFMGELGNLKKFHQHLTELSACKNAALVVEASYGDFLNPAKIKPYTGQFGAKAIAEIQANHSNLPIIFADSRKMAEIWAQNFFTTVNAKSAEYVPEAVREAGARHGANNKNISWEDEARRIVFSQMPDSFTTRNMADNLPQMTYVKAGQFLKKLENEGVLEKTKIGNKIIWKRK